MPKLNTPLQLCPVFKEKIWGRRDLEPLYPDHWTTFRGQDISIRYPHREGAGLTGEVWLTGDESTFKNGPLAGMTLAQACRKQRKDLCGDAIADGRFPILAKFLFTSQWLSVQVHPADDYARKHESGSRGKCEMWYIIQADPDAEMMVGLKPGVTSRLLGEAIDEGNCAPLLQRFTPHAGEAVFVPPGTVHALGPGLVLFEAEENSDVTYRLDDFGRLGKDGKPRAIHREKALAVSKPGLPALRNLPRYTVREPYGRRRLVNACSYFAVEELSLQRTANFKRNAARVDALAVISGEGRVETSDGWYAYRSGDIWLIPPAAHAYRLVPESKSSLLKFYVPDIEDDFIKPLTKGGWKRDEAERVVFRDPI
ncbi:MAG: class I mannose-6-phosphate isomerase [Acidobacteriota bacterium]|nr:class I mannose-6-phosphate isomerase [Acidobacteriota bacterium]